MTGTNFLTAEWRKLVMLNYEVDPDILKEFIPAKTSLDFHQGKCYVSLVGFKFVNTKVRGVAIPFHRNFEEVNLRFYVQRDTGTEVRRGVVFIKEIVPRRAITFVANRLYGEKYETMSMEHEWFITPKSLSVAYRWKKRSWHHISVNAQNRPKEVPAGSEADFITNHFWGYTKLSDSATSEYEVTHPVWHVYPVEDYSVGVNFGKVYGNRFASLERQVPVSVFLAEGSSITVKKGSRL